MSYKGLLILYRTLQEVHEVIQAFIELFTNAVPNLKS